jgi:hypothetical protein
MDLFDRSRILTEFSQQTIFFPGFQTAYSQLQKVVESTALRRTPSTAFLLAESGAGKTRLCTIFCESFGPVEETVGPGGIQKIIPALYCLLPAPITVKGVCVVILDQLGKFSYSANTAVLTLQIVKRLRLTQTRVIVLDEIQRLLTPEAEKVRAGTMEWIVTLLSLTGIAIILSGTEKASCLMDDDPAFTRRYCYMATLHYLRYSESVDSEFHLILEGLDRELYRIASLSGEVHLHDLSMKIAIYTATVGNLEYMRQLIFEAASICLLRADPVLKRSDFADACCSLLMPLKLTATENPFNVPISESLLLIRKYIDG